MSDTYTNSYAHVFELRPMAYPPYKIGGGGESPPPADVCVIP